MLVFRMGQWHQVELPDCIDPSWGCAERAAAASVYVEWRLKGLEPGEAWCRAEEMIYGSRGKSMAPQRTKKKTAV